MALLRHLTIENLKTEQGKAGALLAGLVGLLTVIATNIDKIMDAYRYLTENVEATAAKGAWLGVFANTTPTTRPLLSRPNP